MNNSAGYLCFPVTKDCINPDSYGETCVGCGCCSKDKTVRYPARLKLYQNGLERELQFSNWRRGFIRLQKSNTKINKTYCRRRIAIYKRLIESLGAMK